MRYLSVILLYILYNVSATAQPKWVNDAGKSVVTLHAIQQNGDTLRSAAFFVDEGGGTLIAPMKTVQRAKRAWAVDAKGTTYDISRIGGFNSTYNVVKLLVGSGKKPSTLPTSKTQPAEGSTVYLMPDGREDKVAQVEKAGDYGYYTLSGMADPDLQGNPMMNEKGEVIAVVQTPVQAAKAPLYALDIRFLSTLAISAMDVNHTDLQSCSIPKQLPSDETQAKSFMYLCQGDVRMQVAYADDFIQAYPQSPSGYVQKAEFLANAGDYNGARAAYEEGLKAKVADQYELLYSRSSTVYNLAVQGKELPADWTLESALADVRKAYSLSPLPIYTLQEARILYATKQYGEAGDKFLSLTLTNMRSPDLFIYTAQCREQTGATKEELLALNDSAVACFSKPYPKDAANYLWLRSTMLRDMQRYREAIADLNDYEHLMSGMLTSQFYYEREQMEAQVRMLPQAINDIQKAIQLAPKDPLYHAEQAVLLYRANSVDEAIQSCRKAIELDPSFPDAHRLLGICLRDKGNLPEAKAELRKATDLGDELSQGLLDKMQ